MTSRLAAATLGALLVAHGLSGQEATFSSESRVVVLHVAVRDKGGYVNGLEQPAFRVFENKKPQAVSFFSNQDAPVTVGLVIDSSGSMGANRARVIAAGVAFASTSNPDDDIFVLGFNEHIKKPLPEDAPFTRDVPTVKAALDKAISARGQSAVYDAIHEGLAYVDRGQYERKVLLLVSDGGDNASAISKAQILAEAEASNAVIYCVGVIDPDTSESDPGFLKQLADASGGQSFRPDSVSEVSDVLQRIAHDIRNMYTVGYVPGQIGQREELRQVTVEVTLPNGRKATVRTRRAYLAGDSTSQATRNVPAQ